jgi:glycosyltransferase involved in cell wall biosynthesis
VITPTTPYVVICHPARQHSHQLALGLAKAGLLKKYITGTPAHPNAIPRWQRPLLRRYLDAYAIDVDPTLVEHHFLASVARKVAGRLGNRGRAVDWSHRMDGVFDCIAAKRLQALRVGVVVAYENAAEATFKAAKRLGIVTVLDAASFHHAWQDRLYPYVESSSAHARIIARKDREIRLADYVLVVSELARQSYLEFGVAADRVLHMPLGVDISLFQPKVTTSRDEIVRFLFVGNINRVKGADLLYQAAEALNDEGIKFELTLVGKVDPSRIGNPGQRIRHLGWLTHHQLAGEIVNHDVLVLPSRFDSFGMVVAEAMACGLPVIVSDQVGAKDLVKVGENGIVIRAGNAAALADGMRWFIEHRHHLSKMSLAARVTAEQHDWTEYHRRAFEFFTRFNCGSIDN